MRKKATLSQHLKILTVIVLGFSLTSLLGQRIETLDNGQESFYSLNYEFLGKVEAIHQVKSNIAQQTQPLIEILNLNPGANLSIEKMKLCKIDESQISIFNAEQTLKLIWESKNKGKLLRISYSSMFEKCIESVKMVESPTTL